MSQEKNIIAIATPAGAGAVSIIRISGPDAWSLVAAQFKSVRSKDLLKQTSHSIHLGHIADGAKIIDQVLVSLFKGPNSYTGENVVEINCHGSSYIQQEILQLFLRKGCKMAEGGEFTLRAFLNGKLDLSQAEAVADLIASDNAAAHQIAMQQMRGGFSSEIKALRQELLNFASLIELELDFAEEDVAFADREAFKALLDKISKVLRQLIDSFALGNVIKNGIPVAIVGAPNAGKSTLLNALLNEERAIVSDIAGTTRDTIEDEISIGGIGFRFIDTAGIRDTKDQIEQLGIAKTFEKIEQAQLVVYMVDLKKCHEDLAVLTADAAALQKLKETYPKKPLLVLGNKADLISADATSKIKETITDLSPLSAKEKEGIESLKEAFLNVVHTGALHNNDTIVSNSRHYNALLRAQEEIGKVQDGLAAGLSSDLMAIDIRQALYHFGEITGEISSDELLGNIFANFCIGK
jgi:tRNA modification GTPase